MSDLQTASGKRVFFFGQHPHKRGRGGYFFTEMILWKRNTSPVIPIAVKLYIMQRMARKEEFTVFFFPRDLYRNRQHQPKAIALCQCFAKRGWKHVIDSQEISPVGRGGGNGGGGGGGWKLKPDGHASVTFSPVLTESAKIMSVKQKGPSWTLSISSEMNRKLSSGSLIISPSNPTIWPSNQVSAQSIALL